MYFLKSQSSNLSPENYQQKFQNPHQIISNKGDPESDQKDKQILNNILSKYYNNNQHPSTLQQRIITEITAIVNQWMRDMVNTRHNLAFDFEKLGYGLKLFGSYSLKTNSQDGDIDMLIIAPQFINRERDHFQILTNYLRKHQNFKEIYSIPKAVVPLIRLTLYGVKIVLILSIINQDLLIKNHNFFDTDVYSEITLPNNSQQLRGINGYRFALYLKENYVKRYKNYRVTLKAIKLWAKKKGVYSQIYGYLGGTAFSIMLAKICQLYPNYSALQLLDRFFFIYANWVWSVPVIIQETKSLERPLESQMVILTPLKPHMNAGHYISKITSNITRNQFRIASKLIQEINKGKKNWQDLFLPFDFFNEYKKFVEISVMGQKLQDFVPWKGNIESKLRKFIQNLQQDNHGVELNPYPKAFTSKHPNFRHCSKYYIGINQYQQIDLSQSVRGFLQLLQSYPEINKVPYGITHLTRQEISTDILETFSKGFEVK